MIELATFHVYTHKYITIDCKELLNIFFKNDNEIILYLKNIIKKNNNNRYELTITKNKNIITFNMNNINNIINTIMTYYKIIHIFKN
jgi:hypothetical protein